MITVIRIINTLFPCMDYMNHDPNLGGIYSPNALVIRASEQENYEFLPVPKKMSFVVRIVRTS